MARLIRTNQAREDVLDIWAYIARDNSQAADKLVRKLDDAMQLLAENPTLGIPQFQYRQNLRCKPVAKRYVIFYEPVDDGVRVLRVLHGARDWRILISDES